MPRPFDVDWQTVRIDVAGLGARVLSVFLVLVGSMVLYRIGRRVILRAGTRAQVLPEEARRRADTVRGILLSVWKYVAVFAMGAMLLALFPGALVPAAAIVGAAGLVVAFGVQSLFKDVIAGMSMLLEGQFIVGDRVRLFGVDVEGSVEAIGLRVTVLREDDGTRVFVPNGAITAVRNLGRRAAPVREEAASARTAERSRRRRPLRESPRQAAEPAAPARPAEDRVSGATQTAPRADAAPVEPGAGAPLAVRSPEPDSEDDDDFRDDAEPARAAASRRRRRGGARRRGSRRRAGAGSDSSPNGATRPPQPDVEPREVLDESPWPIE